MASRTAVLTILVVVSLVFAGHVKGGQLGGSNQGQQPVAVAVAGGVVPKSECSDTRLYKGPCVEAFCTAACLLQMHQGGHCKGSFLKGVCSCFWCS